jgi:OOP family OmpA-OmpF porin
MKSILFFLFVLTITSGIAQNNLVNNWSFESSKNGKAIKVKTAGMIEECMGWTSPTTNKADIYTRESKEPLFQVPINQYGRQDLDDGSVYAGIVTYGDKEKTPKTYLQSQLTTTLEKDVHYCVNFKVSLSDLSKVANNNLGALFTKNGAPAEGIKAYQLKPQVTNKGNKVMDDQYLWTEICGMFKANGDEQYITIGNFSSDVNTQILKVKKPKEFNQQQIGIGVLFY